MPEKLIGLPANELLKAFGSGMSQARFRLRCRDAGTALRDSVLCAEDPARTRWEVLLGFYNHQQRHSPMNMNVADQLPDR